MALQPQSIGAAAFNDNDAGGNNYFAGKPIYIYKANGSYANIYSDSGGSNPIPQNGINNVTGDNGVFTFYIDGGEYYAQSDGERVGFWVTNSELIESYAIRAEDAALKASSDAKIFDTAALGVAGTVNGDYFSVVSPTAENYFDLYKNESDTAAFQKSYPSARAIKDLKLTVGDIYTSSDHNFMDGSGVISGEYYNASGTISTSPSWSRTERFSIIEGQTYIYIGSLNSSRKLHLFDSNGDFVRVANPTAASITELEFAVNAGEVYAAVSLMDSESGQSFKLKESFVNDDIASKSDLDLYKQISQADDEHLLINNKVDNILKSKNVNLINPSEYIAGSYYATGGTIGTSPTWSRTPQIPVNRNTDYTYKGTLTSSRNIHLFSDKGEYIKDARTLSSTVDSYTFNTGDADFVGISILDSESGQLFSSEKDIVNSSILSSNSFNEIPHTQKGGIYKLYQAEIKNPLSTEVKNHIAAVNVRFEEGVALNDSCIELVQYIDKLVPDESMTGTVTIKDFSDPIPCQFGGDVNDNLRFKNNEDGYYSSGYLKNGKLYFFVDLLAGEEKRYYIKVYTAPATDIDSRISVENTTDIGGGQYLTAKHPDDTNEFKLHIDGSLTPLQMFINGVSTYNGTRRLFYTSTIKGDGSTIVSMQPNSPQEVPDYLYSEIDYRGSGVVFKDIVVKFVHNEHKNLEVTYKFRFFATGFIDVDATCRFIDEQDTNTNNRLDQLYHGIQMHYDSASDEVMAITPNINYIPEGHHRFSINKNGTHNVCGVITSNVTQTRPIFSHMSDISTSALAGTTLRMQAILRNLKDNDLGTGAYTNCQMRLVFSGSTELIDSDRYFYTSSQKRMLNKIGGTFTAKKTSELKRVVKSGLSAIVGAISERITQPATEGFGSYAQFQLSSILLGDTKYTINDVLDNYELMREQYRKTGLAIDYFESYFGISLANAQAADNGTTYYPPYNPDNSARPFATQKLGRDFHITRALIDYYQDDNDMIQALIDDAQNVIDNPSSSQALKDSMALDIERYNLSKAANDSKIDEFLAEVKLLADACVYIELYNSRKQKEDYDTNSVDQTKFEPNGRVALQWKSSPIEPLNGSTTIMRFLNDAIELLPSDANKSSWQTAYSNLRYYVTNFLVKDTNIVPYGYDRSVSIRNYLNYSTYTMYDFVFCEKPTDFSAISQILDTTLSSGITLDLITAAAVRRGQINTYLYTAFILSKNSSTTNMELVKSIVNKVVNSCFTVPDDLTRTITLNDWENNEVTDQQDFDITVSGTILALIKEFS